MRNVPKSWNYWCRKNKLLPGHNTKQGRAYALKMHKSIYEDCLCKTAHNDHCYEQKIENDDFFYCGGSDGFGVTSFEEAKMFCCQIPYIQGKKRHKSKKNKHWEWNVLDRNGRRYRITDYGTFQICDGNFDRWANSVGAEVPIPKNEKEFDEALKTLRERSSTKSDIEAFDQAIKRNEPAYSLEQWEEMEGK